MEIKKIVKNSRFIKDILKIFLYKKPFSFVYDFVYSRMVNKKIKTLPSKPRHLDIETTNLCNANCVMCPRDKMTRKKGIMSFEIFQKIIEYCNKNDIESILLSFFGEPLLDKDLFTKIKYAKSNGIEHIAFFTNASLMNEEKQKQIIESGIDVVAVSIDAASKSVYEKIRKGLDFDVVVGNIRSLAAYKKTLNSNKPYIKLIYTSTNINENERNNFLKEWGVIVDEVEISIARNWSGDVAVSIPSDKTIPISKILYPCIELWNGLLVLWNGDIIFCCNDYDGRCVLGNVTKDDIGDIWTGEKITKFRQMHMNNESGKIPICKNCTMYLMGNKINWWSL